MQKFTLHDQHVHTSYSVDSEQDMKQYIELAISKGCRYFVMTDHLDINFIDTKTDWVADYVKQKEELITLQDEFKDRITLLQGIEVGYKSKYLDKIKTIAHLCDFDLVNLSIHDYEDYDFYRRPTFEKYGIDHCLNVYFDLALEAIDEIDFDVFCHIDYAFKAAYLYDNAIKLSQFEDKVSKILCALIKKGKCLEINTKVQEFIKQDDHVRYLLNLYYSLGGRDITISSDAHRVERYLSSVDKMVDIAKECGFTYLCYFVKRKKNKYFI